MSCLLSLTLSNISFILLHRNMDFQEEYSCPLCHSRHGFRKCRRFLSVSPLEKRDIVHRHKACLNCLGLSHQLNECQSRSGCFRCWDAHHTLLHLPKWEITVWTPMTAWAILWTHVAPQMRAHVRILLEPMRAQSIYMPTDSFPIPWDKCLERLPVRLTCLRDDKQSIKVNLQRHLGNNIIAPCCKIRKNEVLKHWAKNKMLADHGFNLPYPCSIVLGSDVAGSIYRGLPCAGGADLPLAQDTVFGWALFGEVPKDVKEKDD